MLSIHDTLDASRILTKSDIDSKKRVLEAISQLLAEDEEMADEIFQALIQREKLGSTGLGHGIAIPHTRIANVDKPKAAIITLKQGVEFDTPDDQPVDLFIGLLVPAEETEVHLSLLSQLTGLLRHADFRDTLRRCRSKTKLLEAFEHATSDTPSSEQND